MQAHNNIIYPSILDIICLALFRTASPSRPLPFISASQFVSIGAKIFLYSAIKNCQRSGEEVILSFAEGDEKKMNWFYQNICTMEWNENQDAGYPIKLATEEKIKEFPDYEKLIKIY